jgi:hypothetical protein
MNTSFTTTISKKNFIVRVCYELNRQLTKDEPGGLGQGYYIEHKKGPNTLQTQFSNWEDVQRTIRSSSPHFY